MQVHYAMLIILIRKIIISLYTLLHILHLPLLYNNNNTVILQ